VIGPAACTRQWLVDKLPRPIEAGFLRQCCPPAPTPSITSTPSPHPAHPTQTHPPSVHPPPYPSSTRHPLLIHPTPPRYPGSDRSMLVPNCIFRANGAAILLSNKRSEGWCEPWVAKGGGGLGWGLVVGMGSSRKKKSCFMTLR